MTVLSNSNSSSRQLGSFGDVRLLLPPDTANEGGGNLGEFCCELLREIFRLDDAAAIADPGCDDPPPGWSAPGIMGVPIVTRILYNAYFGLDLLFEFKLIEILPSL